MKKHKVTICVTVLKYDDMKFSKDGKINLICTICGHETELVLKRGDLEDERMSLVVGGVWKGDICR